MESFRWLTVTGTSLGEGKQEGWHPPFAAVSASLLIFESVCLALSAGVFRLSASYFAAVLGISIDVYQREERRRVCVYSSDIAPKPG